MFKKNIPRFKNLSLMRFLLLSSQFEDVKMKCSSVEQLSTWGAHEWTGSTLWGLGQSCWCVRSETVWLRVGLGLLHCWPFIPQPAMSTVSVCVCGYECMWNQGSCWLVFWNMWLCRPGSDWDFKGVVGSIILNNIIMDFDQPLLCDCIYTQQLCCTVWQIYLSDKCWTCFWN